MLSDWWLIHSNGPGQWHYCLLVMALGNDITACWNVFLQVEWSNSQNRNVDLHIRIEWVRGICFCGAPSGKRCQHRRHLSTQTGTNVCFCLFHGFSLFYSYTQFLEFSNYLPFCSLIHVPPFILFPHFSPFPFLVPFSISLPHCTPTSAGSFPESASHSKTCTAFRDTATYGWSHLVSIHWLCDC